MVIIFLVYRFCILKDTGFSVPAQAGCIKSGAYTQVTVSRAITNGQFVYTRQLQVGMLVVRGC